MLHALLLTCVFTAAKGEDRPIDFNRDIRPILSDKCYACHGPDEEQRQGGDLDAGGLHFDTREGAFAPLGDERFAIVAGKPEESELVRRITSTDEYEVMPPADYHKRLSDEQKELLTEWIRQGAEWSSGHWSYAPPVRYAPPPVDHTADVRNWIDRFILARLEREGLSPSPPADKRTLIRRVTFDVTGLPPEPEDVEAFLADESAAAWERVVDRLLNSPHYGERMAIYWLDLVRYADTVGYHGDQNVSISPYRDYVIAAFNANMPFDRFTREQLAGDLLPEPTRDQLIASGYNRLGMMSAEGGVQPKEYLAKYAADRVRTTSAVWLGSTLACAECHDHKFDPFTTKDFYRFASFFADIKEKGLYASAFVDGKWGPSIDIADEQLHALLEPIDARLAELQKEFDTQTPELTAAQRAWEQQVNSSPIEWHVLQPVEVSALHGTEMKVLDDGSILASGPTGAENTYTVEAETTLAGITGFLIEVLPHESLPNKGPGRGLGGNFVLTELTIEAGGAGDDAPAQKVSLHNARADFEQRVSADANPYKIWNAASVIDGDEKGRSWGWAISPQEGRPHQLVVETVGPLSIGSGGETTRLTFRLDQNLEILPDFTIGRFRVSATTASPPLEVDPLMKLPLEIREILAVDEAARSAEQQQQLAAYYRGIAPLLEPVRAEIAKLKKEREQVVAKHTRSTLITVSVEPREMRVLPRGNWMDDSGEVVQPGVPSFLMQIDKTERATRLDLAEWLVSPHNPLTARVMVNRLWKLFFGTGISKVLDDVGSQGEPPVHPQLLDTLAVEFMESGWNIKHIIKLILMSGTYQQSSLMRDDLKEADPYNRLLARQSRFRLDAEMIRDNHLAVSGLLVEKIGGRSVKPYQPDGLYDHLNFPPRKYVADTGEDQYRRGVYTHWQRQYLHPAMKSFDAPSREECTAERPRSNTPLAALVLLNDPSYVEAARVCAEHALRQDVSSESERIDWIMNRAVSRSANEREQDVLKELLRSQRARYAEDRDAAGKLIETGLSPVPDDLDAVELAAWTTVTRTVFNMHEFITRN